MLVLILFSVNLQAQTHLKDLNPNEYFDFWIGDLDLIWESGENFGTGENSIFKTLNNAVIQENFKVIDDANMNGYMGKSWSVFNASKGIWYQTWVDNQGAYLEFIGEFNNNRIFKREILKPDGSKIMQRMIFYDIKPESFSWDWENSTNNGEIWNLQWRIYYKRKQNSAIK